MAATVNVNRYFLVGQVTDRATGKNRELENVVGICSSQNTLPLIANKNIDRIALLHDGKRCVGNNRQRLLLGLTKKV